MLDSSSLRKSVSVLDTIDLVCLFGTAILASFSELHMSLRLTQLFARELHIFLSSSGTNLQPHNLVVQSIIVVAQDSSTNPDMEVVSIYSCIISVNKSSIKTWWRYAVWSYLH